jgi:hypothetical protein
MSAGDFPTWLAIAGLGAYHGLNPAMGWLFAVAIGLQERRRAAVLQALPPIALGHEASVAFAVALVSGAQLLVAPDVVRTAGAALLILFGAYKLFRPRSHPRWVGMRVNRRELVAWSFLMSTAHGAGLMLFPFVVGSVEAAGHDHALALVSASALQSVVAVTLHTGAMLAVMGALALVVYEKLGLGIVRRAWVNLDPVWATAFAVAGLVTLFT